MLELIGNSLGCPLSRFRVTQVIVADRLQVVGELIDQRNPSGDVEFSDLVFRDFVEEHDQGSQGIPMCSDDHALAAPNVRGNNLPTVGKSTAGGVFQGLGQRYFLRAEVRVTRVFSGVTLVRGGECGWADVVAAAPEFDFLPTGTLRLSLPC